MSKTTQTIYDDTRCLLRPFDSLATRLHAAAPHDLAIEAGREVADALQQPVIVLGVLHVVHPDGRIESGADFLRSLK